MDMRKSRHQMDINNQLEATVKEANRPSQDWKAGQKLPSAYHSNAYKVDHQNTKNSANRVKTNSGLK